MICSSNKKTCLFLMGLLLSVSCFNALAGPPASVNQRFNGSKFKLSGNWLATIGVGLGVNERSTNLLSQTLKGVLVTAQGGFYQHTVELNDHQNPNINKSMIEKNFVRLIREMQRFKTQNPYKKRRLVISLTGHGTYNPKSRSYDFWLSREESFSGEDLAAYLSKFPADEIIVVIQSCQSGSLVNDNMVEFVESLKTNITTRRPSIKQSIAVVTPANRYLSSPLNEFEHIIAKAFSKQFDVTTDNIITYGEWKSGILTAARSSEHYIPLGLIDAYYQAIGVHAEYSGLDPQFFEYNMSNSTPLLLTKKGVGLYSDDRLDVDRRILDRSYKITRSLFRAEGIETRLVDLGNNFFEKFGQHYDQKNMDGLAQIMTELKEPASLTPEKTQLIKFLKSVGITSYVNDRWNPNGECRDSLK